MERHKLRLPAPLVVDRNPDEVCWNYDYQFSNISPHRMCGSLIIPCGRSFCENTMSVFACLMRADGTCRCCAKRGTRWNSNGLNYDCILWTAIVVSLPGWLTAADHWPLWSKGMIVSGDCVKTVTAILRTRRWRLSCMISSARHRICSGRTSWRSAEYICLNGKLPHDIL